MLSFLSYTVLRPLTWRASGVRSCRWRLPQCHSSHVAVSQVLSNVRTSHSVSITVQQRHPHLRDTAVFFASNLQAVHAQNPICPSRSLYDCQSWMECSTSSGREMYAFNMMVPVPVRLQVNRCDIRSVLRQIKIDRWRSCTGSRR
jgi:hypothetical protein